LPSLALPTPVAAQACRALAWAALRPGVSWTTARRIIEVGLAFPPPPRGTTFTRMTIGGVPCEEVSAPGAVDRAHALLYFHGGGYVIGSPRTHRAITAPMAAAFGAPVIVPDYRLGPEHPYPAAMEDAHAVWRGLNIPSVAVAGDSAGAGMALELALALAHASSAGGSPPGAAAKAPPGGG
jgi:monoterpene epsilon-lactone hydrolase